MSETSGYFDGFMHRIENVKHPILWISIIGIIIHLLVMSLSFVYDSNYWAIVVRNIESGEGLYGLEGYYYTPVWGYLLGLVSAIQTMFLDIGELAVRVIEALPVESYDGFYISATITSLSFQYSYKIMLMIFNMILAYSVYYLVRDVSHDDKKAILSYAFVFLCPVIIGTTCVNGMPDTLSVTFLVMTIIMLRKDMPMIAGMCFAMSVLNKFFPVFSFFLLIAYIIAKNRSDRNVCIRKLAMAAFGSILVTGLIFLPQIMSGDLSSCFQFLTDRTGAETGTSFLYVLAGYARILLYSSVIIVSLIMSLRIYRNTGDNLDDKLMKYCMILFAMCFLYPPTPQYVVLLLPFLSYYVVMHSHKYITSWKLLVVGGTMMILVTNGALLLPLGVYTEILSVGTAMEIFNAFQTQVGPLTVMWIVYIASGVIQYLGILSVIWYSYVDEYKVKHGEKPPICSKLPLQKWLNGDD